MNRRRVLAAALALACASAQGQQARQPGEYLVTLAPGADENAIRDVYGRYGIKAVKALPNDVYLVAVKDDPGPAVMQQVGQESALVKAVQPNYRYLRR